MPVPASIADIFQAAGSNSPTGGESPTTADDYLRTYASFIALLRDGKGQSSETDVASAATCNIGAANSQFVRITGTTTITSLGATFNGPRFIRFSGALTLTHGANLVLPGAANITTLAGDTCVAVPIGSPATGWQISSYQRAAYRPQGTVVGRAYGEYLANTDLTGDIPFDDTVPQNTEGTQIISVSLTPQSTTSRIRLRFQGEFSAATAMNAIAAIFSSAGAGALATGMTSTSGNGFHTGLVVEYEYAPATVSPLTFTVRVGSQGGVPFRMNGTAISRLFGGSFHSTLVVEEIAP